MTDSRKQQIGVVMIARVSLLIITALVFLVVYTSSYLALVVPWSYTDTFFGRPFVAHYRRMPFACSIVFLPAQLIDEHLRPEKWRRPDDPNFDLSR